MSADELNPFRGMAMGLHNHVPDDECTDDCSFYPMPDLVTEEVVEPRLPLARKSFPAWAVFDAKGFLVTRLIREGGADEPVV